MGGTRDLGDGFETTDEGLHLHDKLVKTVRTALTFASTGKVQSFSIKASALATKIVFEMPAFDTATVTGVVSIENSDGIEIYASTSGGESETHIYSPDKPVPIVGTNTIIVTLDEHAGSGGGDCYVTIYLKGGK